MNTDNIKKWTQELRTTSRHQSTEYLCNYLQPFDEAQKQEAPEVGFCCLGIGTLLSDPENGTLEPCASGLAPYTFIEWLGLSFGALQSGTSAADSTWDVALAIPEQQGFDVRDHSDLNGPLTAANLNDGWHLTFSQIADMVDYFGLQETAVR